MFGDLHTHPFYKPYWRRVAIVATTVAWFGFEVFVSGSPFWGVIAAALVAFTAWNLLITYPKNQS